VGVIGVRTLTNQIHARSISAVGGGVNAASTRTPRTS